MNKCFVFFLNLILSRHITILSLFLNMPMKPFSWRDKICPLTLVRLWFPDQEGPVVVVRQHEQLYCLVPADAAKQPPEQRRKDKRPWGQHAIVVVQTCRKKTFCSCFSALERWLEQCESTLPHWRRTETPAVKGWCQTSGESRLLVPTVCLRWAKGYLHRDSSHLTGNPPPPLSPFTTPWKSFALWSARTEQPDTWRILVTGDLLVSHLGGVGGGDVALVARGCRPNNHKIAVAVGQNKRLSLNGARGKHWGARGRGITH